MAILEKIIRNGCTSLLLRRKALVFSKMIFWRYLLFFEIIVKLNYEIIVRSVSILGNRDSVFYICLWLYAFWLFTSYKFSIVENECTSMLTRYFHDIVLNPHGLVGYSRRLAACCLLYNLHVRTNGTYTFWDSSDSGIRCIRLDVDRVHGAPFPFPHWNKDLLVSYYVLLLSVLINLSALYSNSFKAVSQFCWNFCSGETPCIIFSMAAIISTPWTACVLFSLLLQRLF